MSISSSSSATVAVEKATSDLLISPDWTMNIDICDSINSNHWQAKDVMKAVKKRLQHRNPRIQLLCLTLIETMVKNCGDYIHFQIADKNILGEMIKIVKKKADMNVRDKILALLDSWQEAFGGPGGKHPQYYWAYDELRRSGIEFPKRSLNAVPIFTPPASNPTLRITQAGFGMPSNSSRRLDETMATEIEGLSLSSLDAMLNIMELLNDMLQAVTPEDSLAIKDEVIVDLVNRCRSNQKKLMQMLTTTGDEELLGRGLELNDSLQTVLAKHDALASGSSGSVLPTQSRNLSLQRPESSAATQKVSEVRGSSLRDSSPPPNVNNSSSTASLARRPIEEDDEEEDEFVQLARRHSKSPPVTSQSASTGTVDNLALVTTGNTVTSSTPAPSNTCTALALPDPPAPVKTSKEQDMIDLLSITLSSAPASPHTPLTPPASSQNAHQVPASSSAQGYHHHHSLSQGQTPFNSYVVPWAQPGPQVKLQSQTQPQLPLQQQFQPQPQPQQQFRPQAQPQPQQQFQRQPQPHPHPQPQQQFQPQGQPHPQQQFQPQPHSQQQFQSQPQPQPHPQQQFQPQPQPQPHPQQQFQPQPQPHPHPQFNPQYAQYSSGYPPPPWAGSFNANHQGNVSAPIMGNPRGMEPALSTSSSPAGPLQQPNSFPYRGNNEITMRGGDSRPSGPRSSTPSFVPSYRLFEDLNVFGNSDPRLKVTSSSTSSSLAGNSGQSMVGGRK
ncbi:TOM1-like protein 6 [Cucurbita pepo subsp. pepo]|uniref:TOM1-like protein 6 n=1 Tax=Cucurbita pepo subsp. pepo TaxID=3664 RepID=UPI000C9D785D|nr:TOM1-like protein 6 [Cucurbita pepo subsp. pepo]